VLRVFSAINNKAKQIMLCHLNQSQRIVFKLTLPKTRWACAIT